MTTYTDVTIPFTCTRIFKNTTYGVLDWSVLKMLVPTSILPLRVGNNGEEEEDTMRVWLALSIPYTCDSGRSLATLDPIRVLFGEYLRARSYMTPPVAHTYAILYGGIGDPDNTIEGYSATIPIVDIAFGIVPKSYLCIQYGYFMWFSS